MPRILAVAQAIIFLRCRGRTAGICLLALTMGFAPVGIAWAQSTPPARYDPRQTEKTIEKMEEGQRRLKPPVRLPGVAQPEVRASTKPMFKLRAVSIDGATTIAPDTMVDSYKSFIGQTVSQADLVTIAGNITDLYRAAGYSLTRAIIPPQDIKDGRIHVKVIEGYVTEIVVKGDDVDRYGIRRMLERIIGERPSRLTTIERQLLLANDTPGIRIADTALEEIG